VAATPKAWRHSSVRNKEATTWAADAVAEKARWHVNNTRWHVVRPWLNVSIRATTGTSRSAPTPVRPGTGTHVPVRVRAEISSVRLIRVRASVRRLNERDQDEDEAKCPGNEARYFAVHGITPVSRLSGAIL
jgi:hypothetical protein